MAHAGDAGARRGRHHAGTMKQPPPPRRLRYILREAVTALPFAIALYAIYALFNPAEAGEGLCWTTLEAPRSADNLAAADPRIAPMRRVAQRIDAIVRGNAAIQSLAETRMRTRWQVGNALGGRAQAPARGLWYQARNHRRSMWTGTCGVIDGADRLPPTASVVVEVNRTENLFNGPPEFRDEQLTAWREPVVAGEAQGRTVWFGWQIVLTSTGRPPWVPVSNAEFLDFVAREYDRQQAGSGGPNPWLVQQRALLARYRASLDAATLAAPARAGFVWQHPDVPPERWPRLVKVDPAFPWSPRDPQQVHLISLKIQGADAHAAAMQEAMQTLDLAALQGLIAAH